MSASSNSSLKKDNVIPIRRVPLSDNSQLPLDYSATPGGTLYSTTPGGTRIIYEREFLLQCRNSPLTKSPPPNLPNIPGVTQPMNHIAHRENVAGSGDHSPPKKLPENTEEGSQFHMDI